MSSLIISHQRCGSTNLLDFVRKLANRGGQGEAFNKKSLNRNFEGWQNATYEQLDQFVTDTLRRVDVVKHIYGDHSADIDALIVNNERVENLVMLYRENAEAAAFSSLIAKRVGSYTGTPDSSIGEISTRAIRLLAAEMRAKAAVSASICLRSAKPTLTVRYEDLFSSDESQRKSTAQYVLSHLRVAQSVISSDKFDDVFNEFLAADKKYHSAENYRHISNLDEILETFPAILG